MTDSAGDAARLRVTLLDLEPAPWREIEVPLTMSLEGLHDAIQAAFAWTNSHLWEFRVGEESYGPDLGFGPQDGLEDIRDASAARLGDLLAGDVNKFLYVYDMGDSWEHLIEVVAEFDMAEGAKLPRFLEGAWRTPPEDVGGAPGFEEFLEAMANPEHEDHDDLMEWYGRPFDAANIEPEVIRKQMARLAKRRRGKT